MVTKYVCVIEGCDFVTESMSEAMDHGKEAHDHAENAGARVTLDDEGNLDCELM